MSKKKTYFLDKKENIKKILYVFYALCAVLFAADFVLHRHVYHSWEKLPGFYAIFGFVACVILVLLATQMRKVLMRGEDYYEKTENKDA
jgi:H+/Cl- antiporter ClcA